MKTEIIKIDESNIDIEKIKLAAKYIARGELVAFPTETVYGLGADALSPDAAKKIYAAKGRPSDNPLIVHIANMNDLNRITKEIPDIALILAQRFWPGPLTMIFKKSDLVPKTTTGGMDTVAVRMPSNQIALSLIRESGCVIAAPSANTSGKPSPTLAKHVALDMDGSIPMIIDGGQVGIGIESTIIDLTEEIPMILRPGFITLSMLKEVLKEVKMDPGILSMETKAKPKAPGMRYKHYAPNAQLLLVEGDEEQVVLAMNKKTKEQQELGKKVGIIATDETLHLYQADVVLSIGSRQKEETIVKQLYNILREMDEQEVNVIFSESFMTPKMGQAIMNRLLKAAGYQILHV